MAENLPDTNVGNIEYISKQNAFDAFNRIKNTLKNPKTAQYDTLMFYEIEYVLEDIEPADVAPVVHAHWIYHMSYGVCKKCGYEYEWKGTDAKNYCPRCGAKMRGEQE